MHKIYITIIFVVGLVVGVAGYCAGYYVGYSDSVADLFEDIENGTIDIDKIFNEKRIPITPLERATKD